MEFQVDTCTVEEANAYMRSDAFAANPFGVEIDPESLLAQYRSGVLEQQLLMMLKGRCLQSRTSMVFPDAFAFRSKRPS